MRRAVAALAAVLLVPAAACSRNGRPSAPGPSVVATVGDRHVSLDEFFASARNAVGEDPKSVSPRVLSSLLDQYLDEVLLERAVAAARPPVAGATAAERRRAYLARRAGLETLGDAELKKEYDAHPDRYRRPALVRLSQLLLPTREAADAALKRLRDRTSVGRPAGRRSAARAVGSGAVPHLGPSLIDSRSPRRGAVIGPTGPPEGPARPVKKPAARVRTDHCWRSCSAGDRSSGPIHAHPHRAAPSRSGQRLWRHVVHLRW